MATVTYQQSFINAIDQIISSFIGGAQPVEDPGFTAWSWLSSDSGAQPAQVDEWMGPQLASGMKGQSNAVNPTTTNWTNWSTAMNDNLDDAPSDVHKWLIRTYETAQEDPPTVPDDVINWTKDNLPTGLTVVISKAQGVKR